MEDKERVYEKHEIQQVSCNSRDGSRGWDGHADNFLYGLGFVHCLGEDDYQCHIGAIPRKGREFYVYYAAPEKLTGLDAVEQEQYSGKFKFVKVEQGLEFLVDEGKATDSHIHGGLGTMTFYGEGRRMSSWSFHCKREEKRK